MMMPGFHEFILQPRGDSLWRGGAQGWTGGREIIVPPSCRYYTNSVPPSYKYNTSYVPPNYRYNTGTVPPTYRCHTGILPPTLRYNTSTLPPICRYNISTEPHTGCFFFWPPLKS